MLKPSANEKVIDWPDSTMWFDDEGVLYSVPKPGAPQPTKEESMVQLEEFKKLAGHKET
jgi:hypothetical protein